MTKVLAFSFMIALLDTSIAHAEGCDKEGCLPLQSKQDCQTKCQKEVAEKFKACADTVTHNGIFRHSPDLIKCKDLAKKSNEECKKTCPQ